MPLGSVGFARLVPVSRETLDRLEAYVALLGAWNARINLVGRNTMGDVWRRHILDSAQLFALLPRRTRVLVDLGSGAGLPGLILAAMGVPEVHLIESDQRKAAFLREAVRVTGVAATVHAVRVESVPALVADAVTARALADLSQLIEISKKFRNSRTVSLFLKGESVEGELLAAQARWRMDASMLPSRSDPGGIVLRLEEIEPYRA
ncbi:MAG TPA: 16S rRNA (guanine(527)-N(7))-methyltransferase RsmG [Stellaceae bacterium]|nr:16S rRNA (guanine(527)-N(7))-methyltransferase RsmG [Stellaceae bacterium]